MISLRGMTRGDRMEYWRGPTDFEPEGKRKDIFESARSLMNKGKVFLVQKWIDDGIYSYILVVK